MKENILIIKFGAMGDVLRTTPILREIGPGNVIIWVTDSESVPILKDNGYIQQENIIVFDFDTTYMELDNVPFDRIYCLDEDPRAYALAVSLKARSKFFLDEHWCRMSISNYDKRVNHNSYQHWLFKACGLEWKGQEYVIAGQEERSIQPIKTVGIETRVGPKWPTKNWTGWDELKVRLEGKRYKVISFKEKKFADYIKDVLKCDLIITPDTLTMHLALAYKVPVIALFTATSAAEIYDYKRMIKIISQADCVCCYKKGCPEHDLECARKIDPVRIIEVVEDLALIRGNANGKDRRARSKVQARPKV